MASPTTTISMATTTTSNMTRTTMLEGIWQQRRHFMCGLGRWKGKTTTAPHNAHDYYYCFMCSPNPDDACRNAAMVRVRQTGGGEYEHKRGIVMTKN